VVVTRSRWARRGPRVPVRAVHAVVVLACVGAWGCTAYDTGLLPDPPGSASGVGPIGGAPVAGAAAQSGAGSAGIAPGAGTVCGDGIVAGGEKCDTGLGAEQPGACPASCPPLGACANRALNGTGCQSECVLLPQSCTNDDGCCPGNCTADNDNDCSTTCGDGEVQTDKGETCEADSAESPCPTDCDDGDDCTNDVLMGSAANCNAICMRTPVALAPDDGCCPDSANANTDNDCEPMCGNGVREGTEECDGGEGCTDCVVVPTPNQQQCLDNFSSDDCEHCACLNCTTQSLNCRDSGDSALDAACESIVACARAADCVGPVCYCGTADVFTCITAPNGPCIAEIQAAAGTTDSIAIESQRVDATTAVGRADILGNCSVTQCPDVCP